jgi:cell wall-associated NlpC family hydrolase
LFLEPGILLHSSLYVLLKKLPWLLALTCTLVCAAPGDEDLPPPAHPVGILSQWTGQLTGQLTGQFSQAKLTVGEKTTDLLGQAMGLLGVPYRRGGTSENTGFDCSGFVRHLYEQSFGKLLPHRAAEQAKVTEAIDPNELKPGDLVFFNTMKRAFSHVGIYVGEGKFIHSPRAGKSVQVDDMRSAYWQKRFNGARRVEPQSTAAPSSTTDNNR